MAGAWEEFLGYPIGPNVILSRLNKVYINPSSIRRRCGGAIDCYNL